MVQLFLSQGVELYAFPKFGNVLTLLWSGYAFLLLQFGLVPPASIYRHCPGQCLWKIHSMLVLGVSVLIALNLSVTAHSPAQPVWYRCSRMQDIRKSLWCAFAYLTTVRGRKAFCKAMCYCHEQLRKFGVLNVVCWDREVPGGALNLLLSTVVS